MDHASQMAVARELRASFSGKSYKGPVRSGGRRGGRDVHDSPATPRYQQPPVSRHVNPRPRNATTAGVSARVSAPANSAQTVPHLKPTVGQNSKQTIGASRLSDDSGSVNANSSQAIPPHLRAPVGHSPEQPAGSLAIPPHLRGRSTQQPAGTGVSGDGQISSAKSQTDNNQAPVSGLGGLQNSRFAQNSQLIQSAPVTQMATLSDIQTAKQTVSTDSNDSRPVVGQSTGPQISLSSTLPSHLRLYARGSTQQPSDAGTAGGGQREPDTFNFHTSGTPANNVFNFQAGNTQTATRRPDELQSSRFAKGAQSPPATSAPETTNVTALQANSAGNAGSHPPVDHLANTASNQPVRGKGGLKDSRFASDSQSGQSAPPSTTLLMTPVTVTNNHDKPFGGMDSSIYSHDSQQRHVSKSDALPAATKKVPAFVSAVTKPVLVPPTTRAGLMTPEPDNKGDEFCTDVEMVDAGRAPEAGDSPKCTRGGVLQSRWALQGPLDTKTPQPDVLGYRRTEPTWKLARIVHPTPTPARFDPSREYESLERATPRSFGPTTTNQPEMRPPQAASHANQPENVKKSTFGGLASSRFA